LFGSAILSAGARTGIALGAKRRVMIYEKIELSCGGQVELMQADPTMVAVIRVSDTKGRTPQEFAQINDTRISIIVDPKDFLKLKHLVDMLVPPVNIIDRIQNFILGR
jgi:hypothetical protein